MKRKILTSLVIGIVVACFYTALFFFGFFSIWQERASDTYFLPREPDERIVIIAIDDKSIQQIGRWPWRRDIHAELLDRIDGVPAVVGYDVSFTEPSIASEDAELADAFARTERLVIPSEARTIQFREDAVVAVSTLTSLPSLRENAITGVVNTVAAEDNISRHVPIKLYDENGNELENFSVEIVRQFFEAQQLAGQDVRNSVPTEQGLMRINYAAKPYSYEMYSFVDVYNGTVPAERFRNKIVLIGATAPNLHDTQLTPVSGGIPMSGVEIHANIIQTLLDRNFLTQESNAYTMATIWVIAIVASVLMGIFGLVLGIISVIVLLILYVLYSFLSFDMGTIRNLVYPMFVFLTVFIIQLIYKYTTEYKRRAYLRKAFAYYVAPSVLEEIIEKPTKLGLGGVRKEMTVLFADIAGFTSISEDIKPETLAHMLNYFFTRVSKVIFDANGVIDKFIGDAVMAFWNAPLSDKEHALNACRAAYAMRMVTREIRQEWQASGIKDFHIRIGINTGEMVVGNMGSDMRFDYTVLGDNVNIASRLESLNKVYGTRIIMTQFTYEQVRDEVVTRLIDTVIVKGKHKGVRIYELIRMGQANAEEKEGLELFEKARKQYERGNFKEARDLFDEYLEKNPDDGPCKVYIERCTQFIKKPPVDWNGMYRSLEK